LSQKCAHLDQKGRQFRLRHVTAPTDTARVCVTCAHGKDLEGGKTPVESGKGAAAPSSYVLDRQQIGLLQLNVCRPSRPITAI